MPGDDETSPVKMPSKTKLATGQVMSQLKGARQARLEEEVRELRAKCEKLEQDYKAMKKKYNQIRMAQAPTTRVVKASTVPTKIDRPKSAAKSKVATPLPEVKGAEEAPVEDTSLLQQEIAELKRRLADSEDARRIDKENAKHELASKLVKISALEAEVRSLMMMVQREQSAVSPGLVHDNSAELEQMRRKVREAEQAAAACAHVARAADQQRSEHDAAYAKLRGQLREVKLRLCKYELECTWNSGAQEDEGGLAGQQRVSMVLRNGRWMGARNANTAGTGASHDQQMTEQRLMQRLAGVPGLQQGLQRMQAQGVPGLQGFDMGSGRGSSPQGMTRWNHQTE